MNYWYKNPESGQVGNNPLPDSIQFENFQLLVSFSANYYGAHHSNSFSLVPAAYALSCADDGDGGTKEKITGLELIALSDYNANYLSGTSLNSIIKIDGLPVDKFIENRNHYGLDDFGFQIDLQEAPDSTAKQSFKLIFKLDANETHEVQTYPIIIY